MPTVDALDARILLAMDDDPEVTVLALARRLGVARNTVHARLRRLHASGALAGTTRRVEPAALGYGLVAFVWVQIDQAHGDRASAALCEVPEVVEVHATTGEADFLVKVVARDPADLQRITGELLTVPGVHRTNTSVSLHEVLRPRTSALLRRLADGA